MSQAVFSKIKLHIWPTLLHTTISNRSLVRSHWSASRWLHLRSQHWQGPNWHSCKLGRKLYNSHLVSGIVPSIHLAPTKEWAAAPLGALVSRNYPEVLRQVCFWQRSKNMLFGHQICRSNVDLIAVVLAPILMHEDLRRVGTVAVSVAEA